MSLETGATLGELPATTASERRPEPPRGPGARALTPPDGGRLLGPRGRLAPKQPRLWKPGAK